MGPVVVSPEQSQIRSRFMLRKLFALVSGSCSADNPDSPQHQEVLLPGYLYGMIIKERLEEILNQVRNTIANDVKNGVNVDFHDSASSLLVMRTSNNMPQEKYFAKAISKVNCDIGARMQNFLATGTLVSPTGLDLQQASGFTIVAEKLNWLRYISHFRSIHRGAFFAELKTTTVRKLLPDAWGIPAIDTFFKSQLTLSLFRFPVSGTYARWFTLWTSQSPLKIM